MDHRGRKTHKRADRNLNKLVSEDAQEIWSEQEVVTDFFFSYEKKIS